MPDIFDRCRVAEGLVRLILFRVLPGQEVRAARAIERRCEEAGFAKERFRIFRLFGCYDLAFIQDGCALSSDDFATLGTLDGITGAMEHVCFKWTHTSDGKRVSFDLSKLDHPLLAICFLKINPVLSQILGVVPEIRFAEFMQEKMPSTQMLGTLGWAEIVLLISEKSLGGILTRIGRELPGLILSYSTGSSRRRRRLFFAEKTLSILGHHMNVSAPSKQGHRMIVTIDKEVKELGMEVRFSATCTPQAMRALDDYAKRLFKITKDDQSHPVNFRFGARDLDFSVPLDKVRTLNEILVKLDRFRRDNAGALIRTHTEFQSRNDVPGSAAGFERRKTVMFDVSPKQAKRLIALGAEWASLAAAVYQFNNLVENRLLVDTYSDLARCVGTLLSTALRMKSPLGLSQRHQLSEKLQYLQQAIGQRAQGAYLGLEESPFGSSSGLLPAGMGIQRVLKALEVYASSVVARLDPRLPWSGYVLLGRYPATVMEHRFDLVMVPPYEGLTGRRHWAMTHEIMHVLQHICPERFSVRALWPGRRGPHENAPSFGEDARQYLFIFESAADVMDYALCCPLGIEDYQRQVWEYLKEGLLEERTKVSQLQGYLVRTFAVACYDWLEKSGMPTDQLPPEKDMRELFALHVARVSRWVDLTCLKKADDRGQTPYDLTLWEFMNRISIFIPRLRQVLEVTKKEPGWSKSTTRTSKEAIARLLDGKLIHPRYLSDPSALSWELGRVKNRRSDQETIALLLSLWHFYQVSHLGPDLDRLTLPPDPVNAQARKPADPRKK